MNLTAASVTVYVNEQVGKLFPLQKADSVESYIIVHKKLSLPLKTRLTSQLVELILGNVQGLKVSDRKKFRTSLQDVIS